jgi:type IV pilus assembly protein PilP
MKINLSSRYNLPMKVIFLVAMGGMLSGCGNNDLSDLKIKIAEIKAIPKKPIKDLPAQEVVEPFSFELDGSKDPFELVQKETLADAAATESANSGVHPDPNRPKEDLELYALDSLKMVGTLKKDEILWALVQSKDDTVHRVKVGNYVGTSDGKITDVSENEIKLMEIVPDKTPNTWREQPNALKLNPTQ